MFLPKACFCLFLTALVVSTRGDFYEPNCSSWGYSCLDCYTQKFCLGTILISNTTCQSGSSAYCDPSDGQCKSEPRGNCTIGGAFRCPRTNGRFPDLQNCTRYFRCRNGSAEAITCPPRHVYNQTLAKCVVKLEASDCFQAKCTFLNPVQTYPGDPSLYYQCTGITPKLQACLENSVFNPATKKCESVCRNVGLLPNHKNCSEFISCESASSAVVRSCAPGFGFNPVQGKCQKGLDRLCFEISGFNSDLVHLLKLPEVIQAVLSQIIQLLARFNIDYSSLLKFGFPEELLSAALLVGDYVLTHGFRPPPLLAKYIMETILPFLPPELKVMLEMVLTIIFGNSWR